MNDSGISVSCCDLATNRVPFATKLSVSLSRLHCPPLLLPPPVHRDLYRANDASADAERPVDASTPAVVLAGLFPTGSGLAVKPGPWFYWLVAAGRLASTGGRGDRPWTAALPRPRENGGCWPDSPHGWFAVLPAGSAFGLPRATARGNWGWATAVFTCPPAIVAAPPPVSTCPSPWYRNCIVIAFSTGVVQFISPPSRFGMGRGG